MNIEETKQAIAVMQAALDGKKIEARIGQAPWVEVRDPIWNFHNAQYRVKPEVVRYRVALMQPDSGRFYTAITEDTGPRLEESRYFIRWLTDWQEVSA